MAMFNRLYCSLNLTNKSILGCNYFQQTCRQYGSYLSSREYNEEDKVDFEVSKNPEEWKYVSRLLPLKHVPEPIPKDNFPSDWKPQKPDSLDGPYFVKRSRNHMIPVYIRYALRGQRKLTYVRHIFGDIWLFSSDLRKYIKEHGNREVGMRVDEVGCKVTIRGDYRFYAEKFLLEKGL